MHATRCFCQHLYMHRRILHTPALGPLFWTQYLVSHKRPSYMKPFYLIHIRGEMLSCTGFTSSISDCSMLIRFFISLYFIHHAVCSGLLYLSSHFEMLLLTVCTEYIYILICEPLSLWTLVFVHERFEFILHFPIWLSRTTLTWDIQYSANISVEKPCHHQLLV